MLRLLLIPGILVALLALMMGWTLGPSARRADFAYISQAEVTTLDPNRISWSQDFRVAYSLWEGLYTLDPVTLNAIPGCADPIENDRFQVFTFHIRPDAKWSNGDDVVAHDFVFGWRRMLQEPGEYTYLLHYIQGAEDYEAAFAKDPAKADFSKVAIVELGSKLLRVKLIHPCPPFPDMCTMPPFFPQHEKSMEKFIDADGSSPYIRRYKKAFTLPPNLVTNGPYVLTDWEMSRRMRFEANPYYWDKAHVSCKTVDQISSKDIEWAYTMFKNHAADWVPEFNGDIAAELRARHDDHLHIFPAFGTYFYSFNCQPSLNDGKPNPFADVRVRQAFSMAIDRQVIVEKVTRLGEIPSITYIPVGAFGDAYHSPTGLAMNLGRAQQLLADAGYPGGKGFPAVSLEYNNEAQHGPIAENIRRQWLQNLGVDIQLEGIELKMFRERLHNKDYAVARASWFGDYNDPSTFTDKYKSSSDNNDSGWINKDYDKICNEADEEKDRVRRFQLYEKAEALLLQEAPILPIYTYTNSYLIADGVTGIPLNPRSLIVFKSVKVSR